MSICKIKNFQEPIIPHEDKLRPKYLYNASQISKLSIFGSMCRSIHNTGWTDPASVWNDGNSLYLILSQKILKNVTCYCFVDWVLSSCWCGDLFWRCRSSWVWPTIGCHIIWSAMEKISFIYSTMGKISSSDDKQTKTKLSSF